MYIPAIHRSPKDSHFLKVAKGLARGALNIPVRLNMAMRQDYPWFVQDSVKWLQAFLTPNMHGFEWGSGQSTIFFAQQSEKLISVEHSRKWFQKVSLRLTERGLYNVTHLYVPPDTNSKPSPLRSTILKELSFQSKPEFASYCDLILDYPSDSFDFVSVDGRARIECAINALDKIKPHGVLILDNSERTKYKALFEILVYWPRSSFANGVWETTIFRKPTQS